MTTRVPSITYNGEEYVLGNEYTAGTGISISSNVVSNTGVTSVNGSTGAVTGLLTSSYISNTAYAASWDGATSTAPSKNAVYDKISSMSEFTPASEGCEGQVLTKTSDGYDWCAGGGGSSGYCLDVLVVGGGGGGSSGVSPGAGGGGVIECLQYTTSDVCFPVVVGCGVAASTDGCDSCFGTNPGINGFLAYGGGRPFNNGGSGGGSGAGSLAGAPCDRRQGHAGGNGNYGCGSCNKCPGYGGGGGAGGEGGPGIGVIANSYCPKGGNGGRGMYSIIDGRCCQYAPGGAGCNPTGGQGCYPTKYCGAGGNAGLCCCGCPGVVLVRYPADGGYGFDTATGGTKTSKEICGCCYCIHTFTSDGTFCITG